LKLITTLKRLNAHLCSARKRPYVLNFDPAVHTVPYPVNIDIRDTVNYKELMKQYQLGPNGAIITSLNLFSTRFDKVLEIVEKRQQDTDFFLCDTPGQIEIFTWSAAGAVITEAFSTSFPTLIAFVIDTPRCTSPITFISNMLYACSIFYKTRLPLILVFNKCDIADFEFAVEWMTNYESFQDAIEKDTSYMASLAKSLSLTLNEFYQNMNFVDVSAVTGSGMDRFFSKVELAVTEFREVYLPELERLKKHKLQKQKELEEDALEKNLGKAALVFRSKGNCEDNDIESSCSDSCQSDSDSEIRKKEN
jgi:GTPase SAR1 family protein